MFAYGMAQQKFGFLAHGEVIMPNHWHSLTTPTEENLPKILEYFFGETSKFIKVCLAEHGYEPPESVWSGSSRPNLGRMMTPEAQLKWAHYIPSNPVSAGLVERVSEYPGHVTGPQVLAGRTVVIERPDFYFSKRNNPESVELTYSMPPVLKQAFGSSEKVIYHLQRALADTEKACRQRGGTVLGADAVKAQHPWSEPRSPRKFSAGFTPTFVVGPGQHGPRKRCARETTTWRGDYRQARRARLAGKQAVFPHGTYGMRVFHNATVQSAADLPPGTLINAPGPLDVKSEPAQRLSRDERIELMSNLRKGAQEDIPDAADTLAARINAGKADAVERTAQTASSSSSLGEERYSSQDAEQGEAPEARCAQRSAKKRVVLRGSTQTALRRRRAIQGVRAARKNLPDPNPPPT